LRFSKIGGEGSAALDGVHRFLAERCDRLVNGVIHRIGARPAPSA
jgi:hypothetical protein